MRDTLGLPWPRGRLLRSLDSESSHLGTVALSCFADRRVTSLGLVTRGSILTLETRSFSLGSSSCSMDFSATQEEMSRGRPVMCDTTAHDRSVKFRTPDRRSPGELRRFGARD